MLRHYLKILGYDAKAFSGHSLRRGAAVSATAAGVSDALIQLLGRWSSDAYKVYLETTPVEIEHLNRLLDAMRKVQTRMN